MRSHLEGGGVMEVGGADAFPDHIPIVPGGDNWHLLLIGNLLELGSNLAHLLHRLAVDEVLVAPIVRITGEETHD